MSFQTQIAVRDSSKSKGAARLVLTFLAQRADEEHVCWPGLERLAKDCNLSERTVRRALRSLEAMGEIKTEQGGKGRFDTNTYQVTVGPPEPPIVQVKADNVVRQGAVKADKSIVHRGTTATVKADNVVRRIVIEPPVQKEEEYTHTRTGDLHDSREPTIRVDPAIVNNASIDRVLGFLNSKLGTRYSPSLYDREQIALAIHQAKGDLDGIEKAINRQVVIWNSNPRTQHFLRPALLFRPDLFPSAYAERDLPVLPCAPARSQSPKASRFQLSQELERLNAEFAAHPGNPDSCACFAGLGDGIDPVAKKAAAKLRSRMQEIRTQLHAVAA